MGSILVILLTLLSGTTSYADEVAPCFHRVQQLFNRTIHDVQHIKGSKDMRLASMYDLEKVFGEKNAIFMNIDDSGHIALIADGVRHDSNVFWRQGDVSLVSHSLEKGVVIRFKGVPPETIKKLSQQLLDSDATKQWSFTCFTGACDHLKKAGIQFAGKNKKPILGSSFFKKMFSEGFVDAAGNPLKLEIYQLGPKSIQQVYSKVLKEQAYVSFVIVAFPTAVYAGSQAAIEIYLYLVDEPEKKPVK